MSLTTLPATILESALSRVRRTALRVAMARSGRRGGRGGAVDLSAISRFPAHTHYPLKRDGLDPVSDLAAARDRGEVTKLARLLGLDIWLVTGYDAARSVLGDGGSYSNDLRHLLGHRQRSAAEQVGGLGMTDPPGHTTLRKVLTPEFTKRRLARLRPVIERTVEDALDEMERRGPVVDLVEHFGFQVPFQVICDLLGMPEVDRADFRRFGAARFDLSEGGAGSFGAAATTRTYLIDWVARERTAPSGVDGLIQSILAEHGDSFDDVELGGLADGVFLGGYETSASMLSLGTYVLSRDRAAYRRMAEGTPEQVEALVEELLRYVCPVQMAFPRFARHDLEVAGTRIKAGDVVLVSLTGANRDPSANPATGDLPTSDLATSDLATDRFDADRFDPTRPGGGHLAFGHGLHRCVGAELARLELRIALTALTRRFPDLVVAADPGDLRFTELSAVYGVSELPVRLTP